MTASVVTLHFHDATLREVLTAFAKQIDAGVTIEATNDGFAAMPSLDWMESTRVSVNVTRASYWDALAAVVKATSVKLDPQSRAGELLLVEHPDCSAGNGVGEQRGVFAMMAVPGARRVGALLFAPMVMEMGRVTQKGKRLLVRVAVEPRVTGTSELAVLRLEALTASDGHSLLAEQHEFVTDENDYGGGDEWARWLFDMGEAPADVAGVASMRGDLRVAAGSGQQGTFHSRGCFSRRCRFREKYRLMKSARSFERRTLRWRAGPIPRATGVFGTSAGWWIRGIAYRGWRPEAQACGLHQGADAGDAQPDRRAGDVCGVDDVSAR